MEPAVKTSFIPYGHQDISKEDIQAVSNVLKSDWLTQGPAIQEFENSLASYCHVNHAFAVNSGTAALQIACQALGVTDTDIVWTSAITFAASANCARYCGASVDFIDIELDTFNISLDALKQKLKTAHQQNKLPKVIIPVHFAGQTCDMKAIKTLSEQYGFRIIEDACHAIGGSYFKEKIGSSLYSDITVFSFHPVKLITTGEGGAITTNSAELATTLTRLRTHGITRDPEQLTKNDEGDWYYEQQDLSYNFRMTDIQAALGLSQLPRLDSYVQTRQELTLRYNELLSKLPVQTPVQIEGAYSAQHLYVILLEDKETRRKVYDHLRSKNIGVNVHYIPVYWHPYYQKLGFKKGLCPNAENYYQRALTLPLFPTLTKAQQDYICCELAAALT
jgi:UDP-4-amino-4,6-dideoxy-N-acetyl-beta-L-altrosamine transaminase